MSEEHLLKRCSLRERCPGTAPTILNNTYDCIESIILNTESILTCVCRFYKLNMHMCNRRVEAEHLPTP